MNSSEPPTNIPRLTDCRLSPEDRAQRLLSEINGKILSYTQNKAAPVIQADNEAKALLVEYTGEIAKSVVLAASELASHRGSDVIEEQDIVLVLGKKDFILYSISHESILLYCEFFLIAKKYGIEVAGAQRPALHHHNFKTALDSADKAYQGLSKN